jgi:hypothetical protein
VPEKALVEQLLKAAGSPAAQPSDVRGPTSASEPKQSPPGEPASGRGGSGLIIP